VRSSMPPTPPASPTSRASRTKRPCRDTRYLRLSRYNACRLRPGKPGWPSLGPAAGVTISGATGPVRLPPANVRSGHRANPVALIHHAATVLSAVRAGETENLTDSVSALDSTLVPRGAHVAVPSFSRHWCADRRCCTPTGGLRQRGRHLRRQQQDQVRR
jgi:hypothetical protein